MTINETRSDKSNETVAATNFDMKLEVIVIPVSDADRAKDFCTKLGWRLDADRSAGTDFRLIQFTPPGSANSIQFGINLTSAAPGSAQNSLLVVSDVQSARQQLIARGIDASEVFHCDSGTVCRFPGHGSRVNGLHPEAQSYFSFVSFKDPDGNRWLLKIHRVQRKLAAQLELKVPSYFAAPFIKNLHKSLTAFCSFTGVVPKTTLSPL